MIATADTDARWRGGSADAARPHAATAARGGGGGGEVNGTGESKRDGRRWGRRMGRGGDVSSLVSGGEGEVIENGGWGRGG